MSHSHPNLALCFKSLLHCHWIWGSCLQEIVHSGLLLDPMAPHPLLCTQLAPPSRQDCHPFPTIFSWAIWWHRVLSLRWYKLWSQPCRGLDKIPSTALLENSHWLVYCSPIQLFAWVTALVAVCSSNLSASKRAPAILGGHRSMLTPSRQSQYQGKLCYVWDRRPELSYFFIIFSDSSVLKKREDLGGWWRHR